MKFCVEIHPAFPRL